MENRFGRSYSCCLQTHISTRSRITPHRGEGALAPLMCLACVRGGTRTGPWGTPRLCWIQTSVRHIRGRRPASVAGEGIKDQGPGRRFVPARIGSDRERKRSDASTKPSALCLRSGDPSLGPGVWLLGRHNKRPSPPACAGAQPSNASRRRANENRAIPNSQQRRRAARKESLERQAHAMTSLRAAVQVPACLSG